MKNRARISDSFRCAWEGLIHAWRSERNLQIHICAAGLVIIAGLVLRIDVLRWAVLLLTIGAVISAELLNTSLELVIDALIQKPHPAAKAAKDVAAGAVLFVSIIAVVIGLLILLPALLQAVSMLLSR
ncbi:MAG: diacylglycerol kinase family protein [Chloroflexi bacterium]|nr:diacylglycerol kinase family protein [Chloroflexota bacterium]